MINRIRRTVVHILCLGVVGLVCTPWGRGSESAGGMVVVRQAIPTGLTATSVLEIEQTLPGEVSQGHPFDYRLRVRNLTQCPLLDVVLIQTLPHDVSVTASYPQAKIRSDGAVVWNLGTMAIAGTVMIHVRAVTQGVGALTLCSNATYRLSSCVTVNSTQPALSLELDAPLELTRCEEIPVRLTVSNTGTGTCTGVTLYYALPDGVESADGRRAYTFTIPALAAGASKQAAIRVKAVRTGTFRHQARVTSAEGLKAEAVERTTITEPKLRVVQKGTGEQFAGRSVTYTFTVSNEGDAPAVNVVVEDLLPTAIEVVSIQPASGTRLEDRIVWRIPELPVGARRDFSLTARSAVAGRFNNRVMARAECSVDADARYESVVKGIAAILLEVIDQDDPIEIGGQETYVITATNQGSAVGTNLVVRCELEDNMDYRSSNGPTAATVNGRVVTFAPLANLAPKTTAVWTVTCGAKTEGDVRFKVALTSDQLSRPVEETEATHLY